MYAHGEFDFAFLLIAVPREGYWNDLSLIQLLVAHIGHPRKDRPAE